MVTTVTTPGPVMSDEHERSALTDAEALLRDSEKRIFLTDEHGNQIALPATAVRLVHQVVRALATGHPVDVNVLPKAFSIQQAADLLDVPVTEVVRLLDSGEIPTTPSGERRRIRFEDLMAYKVHRDAERLAALGELTRINQELGGYDLVDESNDVPAPFNASATR